MRHKISVFLILSLQLSSSILPILQTTTVASWSERLASGVCTFQHQLSCHSSINSTTLKAPDWVKNAIFYQIFPDRFRNGDLTNDPVGNGNSGDLLWKAWNGSVRNFPALYAWKLPWTQFPQEPAMGRDWFGGDLKGVQDKAQYLSDLGITAIYFNPIMDSTDNHGYSIIDYKSVNRYFGANQRAANGTLILDPDASLQVFENMTQVLDEFGIRVILDGVFNHVSAKNQFFDRDYDYSTLGAFESQTSPWYDWFTFYNWPTSYKSWSGVLNLPEVNEVDGSKNFIHGDSNDSVIKFWNDLGIDGWRLDTGQDVSHTFWKEFRSAYKKLNPDGYIVGEFWGDATPWLQGDEWDSVMNYRFRDAVLAWALGENVESVTALDYALSSIQRDYPPEAFYTAFNILGSHDTERVRTHLVGDINRTKLAVIFQMTYPGTPVIYYGDEVGMQGLSDPDCRRPYLWPDMGLSPDTDMLAHYKKLISLRKSYSVLRTGSLSTLLVDDANNTYALFRQDNSSNPTAILVYNSGVNQRSVTLNLTGLLPEGASLTDVLNDNRTYKVEDKKITLRVNGIWASILVGSNETQPSGQSEFPTIYIYAITGGIAVFIAVVVLMRIIRHRRKVGRAADIK